MRNDICSVSQVAEILGVSRYTVHNFIKRGHFPGAYKLDPTRKSQYVIPKKDVDRFVKIQRGNHQQN
jgi:excisionase family DNA binding protein